MRNNTKHAAMNGAGCAYDTDVAFLFLDFSRGWSIIPKQHFLSNRFLNPRQLFGQIIPSLRRIGLFTQPTGFIITHGKVISVSIFLL
jgi:hypothetical protein